MHSAERVEVNLRMGVLGEAASPRSPITPLIFQSARRSVEPVQPETLFDPARAQAETAVVDDLRAQVAILHAKVEMVRAESKQEGRAESAAEQAAALDRERNAVVQACAVFAADRERYFSDVEGEVVRLALAIAARVLHREARMDPLLLAASVRVALEKIADRPDTVLRVPLDAVEPWRALFATNEAIEVVGDLKMQPGDLVLESQVGRVELGVPIQLEEIEKGFFDLLQKRPS